MPMIVTASKTQSGTNPRRIATPLSAESPGRLTRYAPMRVKAPGKATAMSKAMTNSSTARVSREANLNIENM